MPLAAPPPPVPLAQRRPPIGHTAWHVRSLLIRSEALRPAQLSHHEGGQAEQARQGGQGRSGHAETEAGVGRGAETGVSARMPRMCTQTCLGAVVGSQLLWMPTRHRCEPCKRTGMASLQTRCPLPLLRPTQPPSPPPHRPAAPAGRSYTVSIAVAASCIENAQNLELATLLAGQIARAAAIFNVDEVGACRGPSLSPPPCAPAQPPLLWVPRRPSMLFCGAHQQASASGGLLACPRAGSPPSGLPLVLHPPSPTPPCLPPCLPACPPPLACLPPSGGCAG